MLSIAGLLLVAGQLIEVAALNALGASDDARAVPHLENALDRSVTQLSVFPAPLPPPDLEEEVVAALLALERLDPEAALVRARAIVSVPVSARLTLVGRRVAARNGDHAAVRAALGDYFRDRKAGWLVLGDAAAASDDIRLRDFLRDREPRDRLTNELFRTTLLRRLGDEVAPPSVLLPDHLLDGDSLAIQRRVLALPPRERYRALRFLASEDHAALVGIPVAAATIDRLYPYLARSRHRVLRDRVRRARSARGEALASVLMSPRVDGVEKRAHADAMRDAWSAAVAAAGLDVVSPVVGEAFMLESVPLRSPRPIELTSLRDGPDSMGRYIKSLADEPDALPALFRFHEAFPERFLKWLEDDRLRERASFVMALSGDPRRLPLLIELATTGQPAVRDGAFRGLAEMDLGSFDKRLHRLAGASERTVRFQTALALVPAGEEWALRLLVAELDDRSPPERLRARRALERVPGLEAAALFEMLVADGTATPFAIELYLDLVAEHELGFSPERVWEILAPYVAAADATALLAAARLNDAGARAAVRGHLERVERR